MQVLSHVVVSGGSQSSSPLTSSSPQQVHSYVVPRARQDVQAVSPRSVPSQVSLSRLTVLSPQTGNSVQSFSHPSPATLLPSSHSSPPLTTPSPQQVHLAAAPGVRQEVQTVLPMSVPSQVSLPWLTRSSPQTGVTVQSFSHPSPATLLPSSHSSPPLTEPSPQQVHSAAAPGARQEVQTVLPRSVPSQVSLPRLTASSPQIAITGGSVSRKRAPIDVSSVALMVTGLRFVVVVPNHCWNCHPASGRAVRVTKLPSASCSTVPCPSIITSSTISSGGTGWPPGDSPFDPVWSPKGQPVTRAAAAGTKPINTYRSTRGTFGLTILMPPGRVVHSQAAGATIGCRFKTKNALSHA